MESAVSSMRRFHHNARFLSTTSLEEDFSGAKSTRNTQYLKFFLWGKNAKECIKLLKLIQRQIFKVNLPQRGMKRMTRVSKTFEMRHWFMIIKHPLRNSIRRSRKQTNMDSNFQHHFLISTIHLQISGKVNEALERSLKLEKGERDGG